MRPTKTNALPLIKIFIISAIFLVIFIAGCLQQMAQTEETREEPEDEAKDMTNDKAKIECTDGMIVDDADDCLKPEEHEKNDTNTENKTMEREIIGPNYCKSLEECNNYCMQNAFECRAWCDLNKETCDRLMISISMISGIPGSECIIDTDCKSGLICLDFKCDIPSPDNLAKINDFELPGGCGSMEQCSQYCADPENSDDCLSFCDNFPSFCGDLSTLRAMNAPEECKECVGCDAKDCILDCVYKCYAYMPLKPQNVSALEENATFERRYQTPIKAVWEAGPAYNRIGAIYFVDEYKELGVNTYSILPKYDHKDGELTHVADYVHGEDLADNETIANIINAKKAGFQVVLVAHDLYDMFPDVSGKDPNLNPEDYYNDVEESALKWAAVAEKYKVEYFVPVNEFEYVLYENGYSAQQACDMTDSLYKRIIPKVREVYKGKIYCRVGGMDARFGCMDFSQCDMFGFTYGFSSSRYRENFDAEFRVGEEVYQRDKKPYVMAEAFALLTRGTTMSDCITLHEAGMQSYKQLAEHGVGYTFMGLIQDDPINKNSCPIRGTSLVQTYNEFFRWMDEER